MVKPWAFLIFLLANGGDGAWVSTPPRQNYGYSSYKNNYQSTSLNSITSQLKDLNWKVSKYKEQLYKAEDEIDSLWVSEVGQDYKIQSLEGKDKQHDGRLYSLEVNNARQDEEIDSLETKTTVNSGRISDNDDDILDLQVKQGELCDLVGDVGEDGDYGENGLVGKVEVLEDKQAELCNEVEELQMNCCNEGDARLTALEVENCELQVKLDMLTASFEGEGPILSCPVYGEDCSGDDLAGQPIPNLGDWETCAEECRITTGCKYWTYIPDADVCYLKSACTGLTGGANKFTGHHSCKKCLDECKASNHYLLDADSRKVSNAASVFQDVESSCCKPTSPDWVVDESNANWYKFDDNSRMHETNTAWPACGGLFVIRLNGIHPTEIGQYYAQFIDDIGRTYEGLMTNCGEFFVYLLPDTNTSSRYCSADVGSNKGLSKFRSNTTLPIHTLEEKMKIWEEMKKDV